MYFYHTQAGGCCDCGDEDAWDRKGFCPRHGSDGDDPLAHLPPAFIASSRRVLRRSVGFLLRAVGAALESFDLDNVERTAWAASSAAPVSAAVMHADVEEEEEEEDDDEGAFAAPGAAGASGGGSSSTQQAAVPPPPPPQPAAVAQEWFLLLHNDDVHSKREVTDALSQHLRSLNNSQQMARVLADLVHEQGEARLHFGPLGEMRALATQLRARSFLVSLLTRRLHKIGKMALLQVQWLYALAGVSGGICRLVVEQLIAPMADADADAEGSPPGGGAEAVLPRLLRAHGRLSKPLASGLHALYLFLMADQAFKASIARAYADTYLAVAREYGAGVGVADTSLYSLSVQFLNRPAFVNELVGWVGGAAGLVGRLWLWVMG